MRFGKAGDDWPTVQIKYSQFRRLRPEASKIFPKELNISVVIPDHAGIKWQKRIES
jgi:hypothetical protein